MNDKPVFRSTWAELAVIAVLLAIGVVLSFVAIRGYQLNQETEKLAAATKEETGDRITANRAILTVLCERLNHIYRVERQDARGNIRTARAAVRATLVFLRRGRSINGITPRDLRQSIARGKAVVRQNRRLIRSLAPLNCRTFAGVVPDGFKIPEGQASVILQMNQDLRQLRTDVRRLDRRVQRLGGDAGGGG